MRLDPPLAELRAALGDWCATGVPKCEGIADVAARLVPTSVALAEEIRRLARGVFPPILSDLGLAAAVRALVRHVGSDVEVDFDEELGRRRFAAVAEAVCYLCCRALVDDAVAADADRVVMHLGHAGHDLIVTGSYVARRASDPAELGVARDRVGAVGGRFELRCGSSVGIDVTVPGA
jgi:signal transduction histidine kinase